MSSELAIGIRSLGKAYHVFARPEDRLKQMLLGRWRRYYQEFWALRDLNLDIRRGEVVGIIGRNGSGKSTLLQMICGTLTPTIGTLEVHGRIAALLELGAGFNPEFTGRENVFVNGAILGVDRAEMERRFDRILAFADIGEFVDRPVKTYSSGMYARLAFAVAINVDPQILIVDEALSVGDEAFQRKCFARLKQIRDEGATVLFVSHSAGTIVQLCDRAVLLDHGKRLLTADPKTATAKYQRLAYAPADKVAAIQTEIAALDTSLAAGIPVALSDAAPFRSPAQAAPEQANHFDPNLVPRSTVSYEPRGARILNPTLLDDRDQQVNVLTSGRVYRYRYTVHFDEPAVGVRFGMMIKTIMGIELAGGVSHPEADRATLIPGGSDVTVTFEFRNALAPGAYFLNAGVQGDTHEGQVWLHRVLDVAMFRVQPLPDAVATGLVDLLTAEACDVRVNAPAVAAKESA